MSINTINVLNKHTSVTLLLRLHLSTTTDHPFYVLHTSPKALLQITPYWLRFRIARSSIFNNFYNLSQIFLFSSFSRQPLDQNIPSTSHLFQFIQIQLTHRVLSKTKAPPCYQWRFVEYNITTYSTTRLQNQAFLSRKNPSRSRDSQA
jgi:hypothetical protein